MNRIQTIIDKEWAEVFKNRLVMVSFLLMPLLFAGLPLIMLGTMNQSTQPGNALETGLPPTAMAACSDLSGLECMQVTILSQFLLFYLMMPMMLPAMIAAYSIVGEKTTRSLEPLLATPVSTLELLLGKALAAALPAIGATLLSFGIFIAGSFLLNISPAVRMSVLSPVWLMAILVLGPILAIISVIIAIFVSSRVNDPRAAEQISGAMVLPLMTVFMMQLLGKLVINLSFMLTAILGALLLAALLFLAGIKIFDRENILTKWK